jgi:hypothetical protein
MRDLLVEADPAADAALVSRVDRLYTAARARPSEPADRIDRQRAIAAGIEKLRASDAPRYNRILLRLRRYDQRLRRFGLEDRHLDWWVPARQAWRFATRELLLAFVLVPLCIAGFILFFVPYTVTRKTARRFLREQEVVATAQLVAGAAIYFVWFALVGSAVWRLTSPVTGLLAFLLLPLISVAALLAIERESAVLETVRAWWFLQRARSTTRERLRRSRSELADVLDEAYQWLTSERERPVS